MSLLTALLLFYSIICSLIMTGYVGEDIAYDRRKKLKVVGARRIALLWAFYISIILFAPLVLPYVLGTMIWKSDT